MVPRRLIRWKSFWFGILMLGFLGVAWLVSMDCFQLVELYSPPSWVGFGQFNGEVGLLVDGTEYQGGISVLNESGAGGDPDWHEQWNDLAGVAFPHWLLISFFLLFWSAFLAWRWRRQGILTKAHDPAPAP